ncbi:MAG: hypothetical protein Q7T54_00090, partial [Candidatus Levybacteria bacterium]|nr:hypothetical protein [Candidatus Levybacteria bacterium]
MQPENNTIENHNSEQAISAVNPTPLSFVTNASIPASGSTQTGSRPKSILYFEIAIYISMALPIPVIIFLVLSKAYTFFPLIVIPYILITVPKLFVVWLIAHKRKNKARIALLILMFSYPTFASPVLYVDIVIGIVACCFLFSPSATAWLMPWFASGENAAKENFILNRWIPRINKIFLVISLVFVFGLDLLILISSPGLFPFWIEMLLAFAVFFGFYNYEKRIQFANRSNLDPALLALSVTRNLVLFLNFIPGI